MTKRLVVDVERARALRGEGFSYRQIGQILGVSHKTIEHTLTEGARERSRERNRIWQEDQRRPGVTITFATKDEREWLTLARNGPGGMIANLAAVIDLVPERWGVVTISTPRTILSDLQGTSPSGGAEARILSQIERVGRLHPSRWPRWRDDFNKVAEAAARPLGRGRGRWRQGGERPE